MDISILTIFPELFVPFWECGIAGRAKAQNKISAQVVNIRDYTCDKHHTTDDRPYGGGCGMVMKPEPLAKAIQNAKKQMPGAKVIMMTPQGRVFNQAIAHELSLLKGMILVCGRYEGIDERVSQEYIDDEISIGEYILTGGELAAMVVTESVIRLIPGVLGGDESAAKDTFSNGLIEHDHYTRPRVFEGKSVPEVLLSGDHQKIEQWRNKSSLIRTFLKRPELLEDRELSKDEIETLENWCIDIQKDIRKIIRTQHSHRTDPLSSGQ